jgi:hypothetical protein
MAWSSPTKLNFGFWEQLVYGEFDGRGTSGYST